jgi:flagellin-like protein
MRAVKGITPIISVIILLLITVALAGAAYTYMSGVFGAYTQKSFTVPVGGAYCDQAGTFHIKVVNTGTTTIKGEEWVDHSVEELAQTFSTWDVPVKGTTEFKLENTGTSGETYTVIIGTPSGVQRIPLTCT